jgi:hypothetical protein
MWLKLTYGKKQIPGGYRLMETCRRNTRRKRDRMGRRFGNANAG